LRWELLSPALIVGGALVLVALERRFPYRPGQRILREGFWTDLVLYSLVQSYLCGLLIKWIIEALDGATALSGRHLVSAWPIPVQLVFFLVLHDLYIYAFHRLQHRFPLLWRLHEAHHWPREVDWLSGSRSHTLEILINQTIEFAPLVLLGAAPELALIKGTVDALWGMYIHSNIDVRSGRLQRILNGPEMHRWHHATDVVDVNFATKFALWDWLFGTAHLPPSKPTGYGLVGDQIPGGYFRQHLAALRPFPPSPPPSPSPRSAGEMAGERGLTAKTADAP
jgi:sterol desaturase/sphingolipid hydroxylase (fatty acid hydroxylase superfamily)